MKTQTTGRIYCDVTTKSIIYFPEVIYDGHVQADVLHPISSKEIDLLNKKHMIIRGYREVKREIHWFLTGNRCKTIIIYEEENTQQ